MVSHRVVLPLLAFVLGLPVAGAAGPTAGPLRSLEQQIDGLTRQYEDLAARMRPPALSLDVTCAGMLATVQVDVDGTQEIAYYAVQERYEGGSVANFVTFVEPGHTSVTHAFDVETGAARSFLLVAGDVYGNVGRTTLALDAAACQSPCAPGQLCP